MLFTEAHLLSKKKILLLTDWYEPGYKAGGPIQSCRNFVAAMHEEFDISILTSDRDLAEKTPYPGIDTNQWIRRPPGISVYYADTANLNTKKITELIREKNPDFIYLNSMYSYRFSILPLLISWRNNIAAHFILAPRGMLHVGALQFKTFKKKFFIRLLNLTGIPKNLMFHATDDQEKTDILKQFPQAKAVWEIPNFSAPLPQDWHVIEKKPGVLKVVYISRIIPKKNLLFFLTLVRNLPEDIQLQINIYGGIEDINYWEQSKELIASFPKNISVSEYGALAHEKVTATLNENHVFILPSKGENFGHAIFESWSAGRPCMISDQTPWHNLQNKMAGWDLPLDNKNSWIHALIQAGSWDQSAFNSWCKNSRAFAERHVGQATLKKDYIKLFS